MIQLAHRQQLLARQSYGGDEGTQVSTMYRAKFEFITKELVYRQFGIRTLTQIKQRR